MVVDAQQFIPPEAIGSRPGSGKIFVYCYWVSSYKLKAGILQLPKVVNVMDRLQTL